MYAESRTGKWIQGSILALMVAFLGYGLSTGHYGIPATELKNWPVISVDGPVTQLKTWHNHSSKHGDNLYKLVKLNNADVSVPLTMVVPKPSRITDASQCEGVSRIGDHFEYQGHVLAVLTELGSKKT